MVVRIKTKRTMEVEVEDENGNVKKFVFKMPSAKKVMEGAKVDEKGLEGFIDFYSDCITCGGKNLKELYENEEIDFYLLQGIVVLFNKFIAPTEEELFRFLSNEVSEDGSKGK